MIKYYSITACSACREKDKLYKQVYAYMRKAKRLDFQTIALTSTEALREYAREVKPYRNGRDSLPMVFDDVKKQELIFDEKGRVQSGRVLRTKK